MADAFTLTLLHFNVQYCAGGLEGLFADETYDASDEGLQDDIVEESLEPVLDVLDAHPGWTFDLELQGYMIEVMAARHPDVLAHLRDLAKAGQVELVSFHYSDQLWTAFPATDMEVSARLTREIFEANDLPLSDVVFTQEGQFSQGMLDRMPEWGWHTAVLAPNLAEYLWGTIDAPAYTYGDGVVVIPGSGAEGRSWSFLNDGELWATNGLNCYLGPAFVYDPDATQLRVDDLEAAEAAGSDIAGIGEYVASLSGGEPLPPVLDGTWQPDDTDDLGLWMGRSGLWADGESDNGVRVANAEARAAVLAAESAGGDAATIEAAWKALLLGEVSDATGWNPYPTEVQYGIDHSEEAELLAMDAIASVCAENGAAHVLVEGAGGPDATVTWDGSGDDTVTDATAPDGLEPTLTGRAGTLAWGEDADGLRLDVTFDAGEGPLEIAFPWDAASYTTVPALGDALVDVAAADVYSDGVALPLSWGLAHLTGDGYVVKDLRSVHLAGVFSRADGTVTFRDETDQGAGATWTFYVVEGADEAMALAERLNVYPTVELDCPPVVDANVDEQEACCCCGSGGSPGGAAALLALAMLRRRRAT